jgi:hypothetical protein
MCSFWRIAAATSLTLIPVSVSQGDEVPPHTLARLGLSGLEVIHDDPVFLWWDQHRPPGWVPDDARPYEPGIQQHSRPTRTFLNRRLTNLPQ